MKIKELKTRIANNKTKEVIDTLMEYLSENNNEFYNEIIVLSSKFEQTKKEFRGGNLAQADRNTEIVRINYALLEMIDEIFAIDSPKNTLKKAVDNLKVISNNNQKLFISTEGLEQAIKIHIKETSTWARVISFKDVKQAKSTQNVYVELDCYVTPKRTHIESDNYCEKIKLSNVFNHTSTHIVLLGQPGAGKTTSMKKLVQEIISGTSVGNENFSFPIVIRFRDLNDHLADNKLNRPILSYILRLLNITYSFKDEAIPKTTSNSTEKIGYQGYYNSFFLSKMAINFLDELKILLILDGFDELTANVKQLVLKEISDFSIGFNNSRIIITSRIAEIKKQIENTSEYEITSLNDDQIKNFIYQWLDNKSEVNNLYLQIKSSPFSDIAIRPLNLAHLCALFERYKKIPEKPKEVYQKVIKLLLEEWDAQRDISRRSNYGNFDIERKSDFLSHLSFQLTKTHYKSIFSLGELEKSYIEICPNFNLPKKQCNEVVDELESHTGIFLQSGYDKYEFSHKSLQEYLTANYIVKLPSIPAENYIANMPSESALMVAISSNPTLYLGQFLFGTLSQIDFSPQFISSFFERLMLEKPDFYDYPILGISILYLFTICKIKLAWANDDFNILLELKENDSFKKSISKIKEYYKPIKNPTVISEEYTNLKMHYKVDRILFFFNKEYLANNELLLLKKIKDFEYGIKISSPIYLMTSKELIENVA